MSEYRKSPFRAAVQRLYQACVRFGDGLEWGLDAVLSLLAAAGVWVGGALLLAGWLPITGTNTDFWLWIALWLLVNVAVVLSLRSARRRRFGQLPSRHVEGVKAACTYVVAAWLGFLLSVALGHNLAAPEPISLGTVMMALLALGFLMPTFFGLYHYVTKSGERSDLDRSDS